MRSHWSLPVLILTASGCAQNFYGTAAEWTHQDRSAVAAAGINEVRLSSRQGPIRFEAGPDDSIRVGLRVGPARGAMGTTLTCELGQYPPFVRLEVSGNRVQVDTDLILPTDCVAEWVISQPARVNLHATVTAGHVNLTDLAGGVHVRVRTGDITARVTDGPVTLETGTGRIELHYAGATFGGVTAETRVGSIALFVNGREVSHQRAPGSGDALKLDGPDRNAVWVMVNMGGIALRLGPS